MSRLTNFITKLLMKKVGIRKEVLLHCNSINLSPGISGLGIVYRGSTAIHFSPYASFPPSVINNILPNFDCLNFYAGRCICQCCGGVQVVFGWQWWGNLELLAVKRVSEIISLCSVLHIKYKWHIQISHHNNPENVDLGSLLAPFLFQISWSSVDSLHCPLKAELLKSGHWHILLLGINLCCNLTSCFKITTTCLAQLGEHRSAEREVTGSNPGQTNTQSL